MSRLVEMRAMEPTSSRLEIGPRASNASMSISPRANASTSASPRSFRVATSSFSRYNNRSRMSSRSFDIDNYIAQQRLRPGYSLRPATPSSFDQADASLLPTTSSSHLGPIDEVTTNRSAADFEEEEVRKRRQFCNFMKEMFESPNLVPMVLLVAAIICFCKPGMAPGIFMLLLVATTFGPTAQPVFNFIGDAVDSIALRALESPAVRFAIKEKLYEILNDSELQQSLTNALQPTLENTLAYLQETIDDENSHTGKFMGVCRNAVTNSCVTAAQDHRLQGALNRVTINAVKEALSDTALIRSFFTVMKEGLADPETHAAALKGAIQAAFRSTPSPAPTPQPVNSPRSNIPTITVSHYTGDASTASSHRV